MIIHNWGAGPAGGPRVPMKLQPLNRAKLAALVAAGLLAMSLSSCASLSPQQQVDNARTRHEQQAEGFQDPMKEQ